MSPRLMRFWLYFRTGYSTYLALPLGVLSTAVTVYYLMIQNIPALSQVFPRFEYFLAAGSVAFIPVCVGAGWVHYKKLRAFDAECKVYAESSPYFVDAPAVYSALLALGEGSGRGDLPEFARLRSLVEAHR